MINNVIPGNDNLLKEVIRWGSQYLLSAHYILESEEPEEVQNTPWSYVVRFATANGYIYLKHTPKLLALESIITEILHDKFQAAVPKIIAHNADLNCFLMKDAGKPLRKILQKQFNVILLSKAIDKFTALQLAISDSVNTFFNIGVPDWRLAKLPTLYKQLLAEKDILLADGLLEKEINKLEKLLPTVCNLCKKLSNYSVKETIVQPDFHDNNILIDDTYQTTTFIDLGEIVISHPFFSLINCLEQAKRHHGLTEEDDAYLQLKYACYKNFMIDTSKAEILDAFAIAHKLWFIYGALAHYRLLMACGHTKLISFQKQGRLRGQLKQFINLI
ncbi:phosphotransferase [Legionella sp. D16C41]|uniref:phosphotransferase n=1 Tax=Legionella sp. D16C41 TaxID=3402688 RepID=UPI003AF7750A